MGLLQKMRVLPIHASDGGSIIYFLFLIFCFVFLFKSLLHLQDYCGQLITTTLSLLKKREENTFLPVTSGSAVISLYTEVKTVICMIISALKLGILT